MSSMMDTLLDLELPAPDTAQIKLRRLSKRAGEDVIFTLQELPYNKMTSISKMTEDGQIHLVLESVIDPPLRDKQWWQEKMGCPTPVEAVKKLLKSGEIMAICRKVDALNGYGTLALEDVAKN